MKNEVTKWQGLEQEFRVGIQSVSERNNQENCAITLYKALKGYVFFDGRPAILYATNDYDGFMRNGSRMYLCHSLPEIATPECRNAFELLKYDKASEFYMQLAMELVNEQLRNSGKKFRILCWKANTELNPEFTRGTHENYAVDLWKFKKDGEFKKECLSPFLLLKPLIFGSGGYVSEGASACSLKELMEHATYVISPRAMVTNRVYGGGGRKHSLFSIKGISNLRLHVDSGEGLRSEVARLLNNAITSYVIQAIEAGTIDRVERIADPIGTLKALSRNVEGDWTIRLENGKQTKALDYLNATYIAAIEALFDERAQSYWDAYALRTFKALHEKLDQGLFEDRFVYRKIEWLMKWYVIENCLDRFGYEAGEDEKEKKICASFEFSNLGEHDLYERVADEIGIERIVSEEEIGEALLYPPENSRAAVRTALIEEITRYHPENLIVRWNQIVNPPTRDEEINFEELDGWNAPRITGKIKEAKLFARDKYAERCKTHNQGCLLSNT
jgi:proteasome accessory factor A